MISFFGESEFFFCVRRSVAAPIVLAYISGPAGWVVLWRAAESKDRRSELEAGRWSELVAGDLATTDGSERGDLLAAGLGCHGAARSKRAAGGRAGRTRQLSREDGATAGGGSGDRRDEGPGVRVLRGANDLVGGAQLHDTTQVHDGDAVAQMPHDPEVVGNEEKREAELAPELGEEVQHLRLNRNVERRDGLVADDEARVQREGSCDAYALLLSAAELVGVAQLHVAPKAHEIHELEDADPGLFSLHPEVAQRFGDNVADAHPGVERGGRVLEDDLDLSANGPQVLFAASDELIAGIAIVEPKDH